jgi:cysteinyl-tRNA synthetase
MQTMELKLYNTLTRKKEEFQSLDKDSVRIYTCGPTVYSYAHIGNFRAYLFMDLLRRTLKYNGYKLDHLMNITDVGHLESDADEGEDKMEKAAKKENKDPYEIAKYYTEFFLRDMERLNIEKPERIVKATDHIKEMIDFVQELIDNGFAYETSKGIYYDISKLDQYPILSNRKIDDQIAGARVEVDTEKRNPYDFALWIKAPENHLMKWDSPWGKSYPGWHIECSAMGRKYLGEVFDIHTGGVDHIPTHHENEIAQCKGAYHEIPAKFWMHCEFLQVDGGKMGKSLGNTYTLDELQERGIEPLAYKLFCFSSNYTNKLNFTWEAANAAQVALDRLRAGVVKHLEGTEKIDENVLQEYRENFNKMINDDLNISSAMSIIWEIVRSDKKSMDYRNLLCEFDRVLGLGLDKVTPESIKKEEVIPKEIKELIEKRVIARKEKNWEESDRLRDEINARGYSVKDTKEGMQVEKL